ncbi:SBBP repeat-containing protein [Sorangium sp. So ce260]|uniref:SBBP repeat-containing protein n=1 Tax=Sorangium sp. So ce260 TaxID=3133291 RepID=UPI003F610F64
MGYRGTGGWKGFSGVAMLGMTLAIGCTMGGGGGQGGGGGEPAAGGGGQGGGGGEPAAGGGGQGGGGGEPAAGGGGQGGGGGEPAAGGGGQGGGVGEPAAGGGGQGGGGGEPAAGGGGQGGGTAVCVPGSHLSCYSGSPETQGVGLCKSGTQTCLPDGSGYGPCTGEVTPSAEDCATDADEDCDGMGTCSPLPLWSAALGGAGTDSAYAVATDTEGNLYVTGYFSGTVDFGAGPLVSAGATDVFVLKLDPAGHALWSRRFGSSSYGEAGTKIALDASGNILLGGNYGGATFDGPPPVDFGGGPLPWAYDFSSSAVFLVKLDPDGNHLWSRGYTTGSFAISVVLRDIAAGAAGSSAVLLAYPTTVDVGMSLATYNAAGEYMWGFSNRTYDDAPGGVAVDSAGNVVVAMAHSSGVGICPCDYYFDVQKRDPAGTVLWQKLLSGPPEHQYSDDGGEAKDVAVDPEDNVLVVGRSLGNLDLGGGLIDRGTHFVVKMSPLGDYIWHREAPSDAVTTDSAGNVIVLGGQSLVKLDASGAELWRRTLTDTPATIRGMTTHRDDHVVLVGEFTGTADFGTGPLTAAGMDGFVTVLGP